MRCRPIRRSAATAGARSGSPASRRRRRGSIEWLRQQHDGPYWRRRIARAGLRRDRGGHPPRRRLDGLVRGRRVPDAGALHRADRGRSSATGSTACRRRPTPGPNLDELHELVRFFDRWLKGIANGADDEPALVWFERDYAEPEPFPDRLPGSLAGGERLPAPGGPRLGRGAFGGGTLPLVGGLVDAGDAPGGSSDAPPGVGSLSAPADRRHPGRAVVGRRRAAERPGARPAPRRGPRSDLHVGSRSRPRSRSSGVPEVVLHLAVSAPVATAVVRLVRRRPRRDVRAGQRRDPQPDPPSIPRSARAAGARAVSRRSGSPSGPPATGSRRATGSACRWRRRRGRSSGRRRSRPSSSSTAARPRRRASSCRSFRRPAVRATWPCRRSRPRRPTCREVGGDGDADDPVWRIDDDVIAGTRDGHDPRRRRGRPRRRPSAVRRRDPDADRLGRRSGPRTLDADVVYRWQRARPSPTEIRARSTQTSDAEAFDLAVDLEVDLDGEPFFGRDVARIDPAPARLTRQTA